MEWESELILTEQEKDQLRLLIKDLPPLNIHKINNHILTELVMVGREIPERIARYIVNFQRGTILNGNILIRNLPLDPTLPLTPSDGGYSSAKTSYYSEYQLLLFMLFLGHPIAYEDEKEGLLIQNICPVKGKELRQENTSSNYFFKFHTENAFHPFKPDHLALLCLRSDHENKAKTLTSSIIKALPSLPSSAIQLLREPLYQVSPPPSFGNDKLVKIIPILSGSLHYPELCVHFPTMKGINPEAEWALNKLQKAFWDHAEEYTLQPGDLLIIDNRKAVHARNAFQAKYDGYDRWLQRMFTVESIVKSSFSRGLHQNMCSPLNIEQYLTRNDR